MNKLILTVLYAGSALMLVGIVGGATATLSGDMPLALSALGVLMMYLGIAAAGLTELWKMDK